MAGPSLKATVEDYDSDDSDSHSDPVLESFRRSPAANVAAKRSHPSDLGHEKSPPVEKVTHVDTRSDSGYSSNYAFSAAPSADSAISSHSSPPNVPPTAPSLPPPSPMTKRRPTISNDRKNSSQSSQSSPRKSLARTGSVSSRRPPQPRERRQTAETPDCTDPNCTECGPNAIPSSRPRPSPLDSALDISYAPFDQRPNQRPKRSDSYMTSPPSPTHYRLGPSLQSAAVIQPAQSMRRRSSTSRPVSYRGGDPGNGYYQSYQNPSQDQRGPPPSMSAHYLSPLNQTSQSGSYGSPQSHYYVQHPGHPMQVSPPYDVRPPRPQMPQRTSTSSIYQTRGRPASGYGPALVTQEHNSGNMPSARYATHTSKLEHYPPSEYDSDSSACDSEEDEEGDAPALNPRNGRNDRALMPPPPLSKTPTPRRPSLRHAITTQSYNSDRRMSMSQSQTLPERPRERDPRDSRSTRPSAPVPAPARRPSISRPALIQHPKAQSAFESQRNAQVVVETPSSRRRQSYQSYDKMIVAEDKRRANRSSRNFADEGHRGSKVYADNGNRAPKMYASNGNRNSRMYTEDAIVPTSSHRRRQTDSDARYRDEQIVEAKNTRATIDAEAYQRSMRGSNDPINDKIHKAAKRASRVPSGPSEGESSRSKGSDKASRASISNRTNMTNGPGGEIRLRVDASAPLNLQFNGDMDGRTLRIDPLEHGMADIVIGNPGSRNETEYRSERGSVLGSSKAMKAIMAGQTRWEAEEDSVRSERGNRSGQREADRRVLQRRRRQIEYDDGSQ